MSTLTIYPKTKEEEKVYLQLAKLLKSKINRDAKSPYNPEFVKKILKGRKERTYGNSPFSRGYQRFKILEDVR
jgi:hypothetical protein